MTGATGATGAAGSVFRAIRRRLRKWWSEPITVKVEVRKSPDWEGDAARYRQERGW